MSRRQSDALHTRCLGRLFFLHPRHSITARLICLFALLLIFFTLLLGLLYNTLMKHQMLDHYSISMQRSAYAISQNLSELIAPSAYESLDEQPFIVGEDTLSAYMALTEHITNCNVYLVDVSHNVTAYFDGVVQKLVNPLLPGYIEQTIALGFMGKTPFIQSKIGEETHLAVCMPVTNAQSRVLGVVLLESTLRELGFAQVPSATILLTSSLISFLLSALLSVLFSRSFTKPISAVQQVAHALAGGNYDSRTHIRQQDEIGSLAGSMDVLAQRLKAARNRDERARLQQQAFFSNISHELRTPVTVIRASLEALHDGVIADEDERSACYTQMLHESRWLERLIADLLELSRLQSVDFSLNKESMELSELLGDVAMSAHTLCDQKGIHFICPQPADSVWVNGDYARLRQMLLAVIDNAVKFTPTGRCIRLWLDEQSPVVHVADEGCGIDSAEQPYIFDRFHHTRSTEHEGTGLGLAIVQEIARRHDIHITLESTLGQGTTFSFTFPVLPSVPRP